MAGLEDKIIKEDSLESIEVENICTDIFAKCDTESSGNVEVSTLIKYISPFIESNEEHFSELKKLLDPLDTNPAISYGYFLNAMQIWTEKIDKRLSDHNMKQSTPTKNSDERYVLFDGGLNISNVSSYSYAGSQQSSCDNAYPHELINELQHKNKKLSELLSELRGQLSLSEELNNNLQTDLEKVKRNRQADQKLIEDLQKLKTEFEKEREDTSLLIKNHNSVTESLNFYKKENSTLKKQVLELQIEVQKSQETITTLQNKEKKHRINIECMKTEIEMKTNENIVLQEELSELHAKYNETESHIKDISGEIEVLRFDNKSLQKCLDDVANKNTSVKLELTQFDSETNPENRSSESFDLSAPVDESTSTRGSPLPHESLQAELIKVSNKVCFESSCEHKALLLEREEEIENMNIQLRQYIEENNNVKRDITNLNKINSQLESQITEFNKNHKQNQDENEMLRNQIHQHENKISELQTEILLLSENEKRNETIQKENIEFQRVNVEMYSQNMKLKSDIASMKNKNHTRLEQKIQKLEGLLFDEKANSECLLMQMNTLKDNLKEINLNAETLKQTKIELEKQLFEKNSEAKNCATENKELKMNINELCVNIKNLEQQITLLEKENRIVEEKLSEEKNLSNNLKTEKDVLSQKIKEFDEKLAEEEHFKLQVEELTSCSKKYEVIITELKNKLGEENKNSEKLKLIIDQLTIEKKTLEETKQELENNFAQQKNVSLELESQLNEAANIHKLDDQRCRELKQKNNDLTVKIDLLIECKRDLKSKLSRAEKITNDLKRNMADMSSNIELLERGKLCLEGQLNKEETKLKSLTVTLNEIINKNTQLMAQNDIISAKNKKLEMNIVNLEQKLQNFRKYNIDLQALKTDFENDLKNVKSKYERLVNHVNLSTKQIKGCTDILGKNTLLATQVWKSYLESIVEEIPVANLVDRSSLSGLMQMSDGKLTEDIKNLVNQTRLTAILLLSLVKIEKNISDDDNEELSDVFISDSTTLITQSTFKSNEPNFSVYIKNLSDCSPLLHNLPSMSPECTQSEMTEEKLHFSPAEISGIENMVNNSIGASFNLNNNGQYGEGTSLAEEMGEVINQTGNTDESVPLKKFRSRSEGTAIPLQLTDIGDITLFPNLQDSILDSLGLRTDLSRDRANEQFTEEEIEAKFQTLALIFSIDAKTLHQRRELQKRQRDQADDNFAAEVARLEQGIRRLAPLCVDSEVTELVTALLSRLNILVKAAQRISISTQVFGGVQQEFRIAAAVNLMLVHLRNVQQQRDTVKRQLLCTKKMLQESTASSSEPVSNAVSVVSRRMSTSANGRVMTRRRASIATIPRPLDSPSASGPAGIAAVTKRAVRRISADAYSEHSARHWDSKHRPDWMPLANPVATRLSRPSRIELGLDLMKIRESSLDLDSTANSNEESDSDVNSYQTPTAVLPFSDFFVEHQTSQEQETFGSHIVNVLAALARFLKYCWTRNRTLFSLILCALGAIFILNIMMLSRFLRQFNDPLTRRIPWRWITWDEFWDLLFEVRITGPQTY